MTQPEALRLADDLVKYLGGNTATQAAAELRRLHAERTAADGVINDLAAKVGGLQTQRDAMQERAEYWKRKHDDEETGAERDALRVQRDELLAALKKIASIEDQMYGNDWEEIEEARVIARAAIAKAQQ